MSEKLNKLRAKLTAKQQAFVEAYCTPGPGYNNATQSAIIAGYSVKTANNMVKQILVNIGVKAAIVRIKADLAAENKFTREKQLKDLEAANVLAQLLEQPSAMVSAKREQNEMLGYHRETAPNLEREAAQKVVEASEAKKLAELARQRTEQEAGGTVKPSVRFVRQVMHYMDEGKKGTG